MTDPIQRPCDICGEPCIEGKTPMFGGRGNGDRMGARYGDARHYDCHTAKYGKIGSASDYVRGTAVEQPSKPIKTAITTKGKHNYSPNASRSFIVLARIREMGKNRVKIECPFCNATFWAFVWSISGGGKKCTNCGAMHASFGEAYPIEGNEAL